MKVAESSIAAVREAVGNEVDIILENHCYTDKVSATQYGNMAKKYGILYFEEPTTPHPDLPSSVAVNSFVKVYPIWPMYMMLGVMRILIIVSTVLMVRAK